MISLSEQEYKHVIHHLVEFTGLKLEDAIKWMHTSVPAFDGRKPIDMIKSGRLEDVWQAITRLDNGIPL